jgi:hypothetical protein
MMVSFVCAHKRGRSRKRRLHPRLERHLAYEIAPSDGALAAATTTSSDFGRRRFMDSFKVTNCHPLVER